MNKTLLLGDEAIAQGAIDAGLSGIYAYPGTPSTEILEYVQRSKTAREKNIHRTWSTNEKTAMEAALGMSYAGKRSMVCMKHVGLNVAADPFVNSSITGANGGMIVVVADDPSMHSSQNEQDSRFFGKFAMIPILEPASQQEAYDMVHYGYEISEKYGTPVMIRITTRLAHSRAGVIRKEPRKENDLSMPKDLRQFVLLPAIARKRYKVLLENQKNFDREAEDSSFNTYFEGKDKSMGIIASGIAFNYLLENFPDNKVPFPVLKINHYPIPKNHINRLVSECKNILVLEEGAPFIEELLKGLTSNGLKVTGRLDGTVPRDGELNPNIVAVALGKKDTRGKDIPPVVIPRPPSLCEGCPHIDSVLAINEVMKNYTAGRVFSDIGCYTLSALPPYQTVNSCVDMGASITMAKGAADAGLVPSIAVIGDSTFTHSGITGLLDAVNDRSPITVFILDNATVAMTGGQPSSGTGKLEDICKGVGVEKEHIKVISPLKKHHEENVKIVKREFEYNGVSVIIPRRECVETTRKKVKEKTKSKAK
ncbi:MAG: thiamine pyrophosphate-dependent enzyme [Ignavibacteria bacterium]|jgi:indolepyruvate ferredoxin oxidoreductase alpha subunit